MSSVKRRDCQEFACQNLQKEERNGATFEEEERFGAGKVEIIGFRSFEGKKGVDV